MNRSARRHRDTLLSGRVSRRALIQGTTAGAIAATRIGQASAQVDATPVASPVMDPVSPPARFATSPQHGSRTASTDTTISFRGLDRRDLGEVRVEGSVSGGHSGILVDHPDGQGVSWIPDDWFEPGEYVFVTTDTPLGDSAEGRLTFRTATRTQRVDAMVEPLEPEPVEIDERFHTYVSRPDLTPPVISITTQPSGTAPGHIFLTPTLPTGNHGRMIVDEWGEPIWFDGPVQRSHASLCLKLQEYKGQPVLTWWEGSKTQGYGFGHWVIANTAYERIAHVQCGNGISGLDCHDLVITPQGTAISLAYNPIEWNLAAVGGEYQDSVADGVIQEIDIETGLVLWEWHSLDHIEPAESYFTLPENAAVPWDYIHLNSVALDHDGNILISARHTHAAYKIDRMTGEVIWRLNGKKSDFTMGPNTWFAWAHDVQRQPDGTISLFDNHESQQDKDRSEYSRGLFLDIDEDLMTASVARELIHPTEILSVSQANLQRLPNGNFFMGWGSAPVFSEFGEGEEPIYNGRLPIDVQSYRAYRHEWTATPAAPPDVVAQLDARAGMTVWVSWNGATEVAEWRVLGGETPDDLAEVATSPREGFETEIAASQATAWVVVEALDAWGRVIGVSEPVTPLP